MLRFFLLSGLSAFDNQRNFDGVVPEHLKGKHVNPLVSSGSCQVSWELKTGIGQVPPSNLDKRNPIPVDYIVRVIGF